MNSDHVVCASVIRPVAHRRGQSPVGVGACSVMGKEDKVGGVVVAFLPMLTIQTTQEEVQVILVKLMME